MAHLKYCQLTAMRDCGETRHAQAVMKELGITYQHATPQSIADLWWFWNCVNVPEDLPKFLSVADWDPMQMVGFGLSQDEAERIRDAHSANIRARVLAYVSRLLSWRKPR